MGRPNDRKPVEKIRVQITNLKQFMATLTSKRVQGDIYRLLKRSSLAASLSGQVYRQGMRPRDSRQEDAVVIFTTGLPDQVQSGVVTVNIFVPDVEGVGTGVLEEDGKRCEEIEAAAAAWVKTLTADKSCYCFSLQQTIYTEAEPETNQHFVVVKLKYRFFDGEE